MNVSTSERNSIEDETPAAPPLQLRITVHTDDGCHSLEWPGSTQSVLVRMYPDTPFKSLTDKLRRTWINRELKLGQSPWQYVFDSDTPASVSL